MSSETSPFVGAVRRRRLGSRHSSSRARSPSQSLVSPEESRPDSIGLAARVLSAHPPTHQAPDSPRGSVDDVYQLDVVNSNSIEPFSGMIPSPKVKPRREGKLMQRLALTRSADEPQRSQPSTPSVHSASADDSDNSNIFGLSSKMPNSSLSQRLRRLYRGQLPAMDTSPSVSPLHGPVRSIVNAGGLPDRFCIKRSAPVVRAEDRGAKSSSADAQTDETVLTTEHASTTPASGGVHNSSLLEDSPSPDSPSHNSHWVDVGAMLPANAVLRANSLENVPRTYNILKPVEKAMSQPTEAKADAAMSNDGDSAGGGIESDEDPHSDSLVSSTTGPSRVHSIISYVRDRDTPSPEAEVESAATKTVVQVKDGKTFVFSPRMDARYRIRRGSKPGNS